MPRIGDYIRLVDVRNKDLEIKTLLGVTVDKRFIPSVANTIGSNMANYKIIRKGQFACSLMQVRRDKKMPVALLADLDEAIISQAYPVFEITDTENLLPEYLMMWMSRSEFDREACFYAVGGVRGSLEWEDFCNMELPVPSLEKQQKIVKEYKTIVDRIQLNENLNKKLEETAQTIYKQWFVDFEFPISAEQAAAIGKPDLEGQPYKSSGGEMVWNAELDQNIPAGWSSDSFTSVVSLGGGGTPKIEIPDYWGGAIPFFTGRDVTKNYYSYLTERSITEAGLQKSSAKLYPKNTTFIVCRGATTGVVALAGRAIAMNQSCYAISRDDATRYFAHQLTLHLMKELKKRALGGAIFTALVTKDFDEQFVVDPDERFIEKYDKSVRQLYIHSLTRIQENVELVKLQGLLLSKMTKAGA